MATANNDDGGGATKASRNKPQKEYRLINKDRINNHLIDEEEDDENDSWEIPPPPIVSSRHDDKHARVPSPSTPLLPIRERKKKSHHHRQVSSGTCYSINHKKRSRGDSSSTAHILFGNAFFGSPTTRSTFAESASYHDRNDVVVNDEMASPRRPTGLSGFFFGFMYEEPFNESFDYDENEFSSSTTPPIWNRLNLVLFAAYSLTTTAAAVPVLLLPTIGEEFLVSSSSKDNAAAMMEASAFTSRAASSAVMGTACGKFLNGPIVDILGSRRTSILFSFLLGLSLLGLASAKTPTSVARACFYVEFFQSVQWPCIMVTLASHYGSNHHTYENGIYVTSIASRFGSLMGIPIFSGLLRYSQNNWRMMCFLGTYVAILGSSVSYLFMMDSQTIKNDPQNPLHPKLLHQIGTANIQTNPGYCLRLMWNVLRSIWMTNVFPSLQHVLKSGTFWIVAVAHTGSSMIRTSERILGSYFHDTSMGDWPETDAAGLVVFSSLGTILGLGIVGKMFTERKERQRKWLVSRLYMVTILACYVMAMLAIPWIRHQVFLDALDLVLYLQVATSFVLGFCMAVVYFHIPGLVGSTFGNHKGLYSAYTDGVAYGISSMVWKIVANAVGNGGADGGGWAYGWAAVALLIILCGILMVEFMEHYFVRTTGRHHGHYETILFA